MSNTARTSLRTWAKRLALLAVSLLALLWLLQTFLFPALLRNALVRQLTALGYPNATMRVDHVSLTSATIRDIRSSDALDVHLVHITYTPAALLAGRVDDLAIDSAMIDLSRLSLPVSPETPVSTQPATTPAARADLFPFSTLTVRRTRIAIDSPAGLPTTADVQADLDRQADGSLRGSAELVGEGMRIKLDIASDPQLNSPTFLLAATADLARLPAWLGRSDLQLAGAATLNARAQFDADRNWTVSEGLLSAEVTRASLAGMSLSDGQLRVNLSAASTAPRRFQASLLTGSLLRIGELNTGGRLPATSLLFQPKPTEIETAGANWRIKTKGADVSVGDVQFSFDPGELLLVRGQVRGRIASTLDVTAIGKSRLMTAAFPALAGIDLGGRAQILFTRAFEGEEQLPSLGLKISDGTIASQQYELTAHGISADLVFVDMANPRTPQGQTLKLAYGKMGKWEVRDGLFQFAFQGPGSLAVEKTELGWAGGKIWCDPYSINLASPTIRTRVYGKELDLGKVVWVVSGENAWGEGLVDLSLPVTFRWPQIRFGNGEVAARPGGELHLDYASEQLGRYLIATDPRFATDPTYSLIRERVTNALKNFRFSKLRLDMNRKDSHLQTLVQIQGKGNYEGGQEVNLNLNIDDLDWLLSRYLALPKQQKP